MVVSQVVNWLIGSAELGDATWRWMLGAEALPALAFTLLCPFLVESPRYLAMRGMGNEERGMGRGFFSRANLRPILLAFCVAMFNQLSGICAVLYFARRVFQLAGCTSETALAVTAWLTALLGFGTFVGLFLIDRIGRRVLILVGAATMVVMHALVAWQLSLPSPSATLASLGIFGFIAFFAMSSGACLWVFISEVFPNTVRAKGQALGCFTHWALCTVISWVFPMAAERAGSWTFAFFAAMMVCQFVWALLFMPETKGGTTEDIERRLGISG